MHDSEVAASIQSEGSAKLAEAYDRYADPLYKYCLAFLGDPAEAADAVQDTFVIAAARLADLREPSRLRAWVYAVGRNQCLRIMPPGRPMFASAPVPYVMAGVANADADTERARLRDLLDAATAGLAPGEREVIELELRHGLAVAEVASVVGVSRARANTQASRAREHLEAGLAAVVVARAGRRDCRVLSGMLDGWDGQLTVALREQLHGHIGRCAICSTRRDLELHPGRLFGQSPGEALAAAAASLRVAASPPDVLRARTLTLVAGQDPDATTPHAAVRGTFDSRGFPKPEPGPEEGPARGDGGGQARRRGRVAVAAGLVAAAIIGVVAVALADNSGHGKLAAGHLTGSTPSTGPSAAAPLAASPGISPTRSATPTSTGSATTTPLGTPTAANRATTPATPPSATTDPTATGSTGTTATPTATAKAPPGTLAVSPSGGALAVPPGGTTISLTAQGGPVTWSSTVSSGLGTVHLSPSAGTINAGATVTVTVTASSTASGQKVTIDPGGTVFTIFIEL